jgi:hypothetical protein
MVRLGMIKALKTTASVAAAELIKVSRRASCRTTRAFASGSRRA